MENDKYTLTYIFALLYFLFQILSIYWGISMNGECLYANWLHNGIGLSPYFAFLLVAVLYFCICCYSYYLQQKKKLKSSSTHFYYGILFLAFLGWFYVLGGLWNTFEYEKGNLEIERYYSQNLIDRDFYGVKLRECNKPEK